jgi:alkylation response protein AidB-like acyl-CoA dehydrogenase
MHVALDALQSELRATAASALAELCTTEHLRQAWTAQSAISRDRWRRLATIGLTSVTLPDRYGGLGASDVELVPLLEEVGYVALPEPVADAAVGASLLAEAAPEVAEQWLPGLASGDVVMTASLPCAPMAEHAADADVAVIVVGDSLHVVDAQQATWARHPSIDGARRLDTLASALPPPVGLVAAVQTAVDRATLHRAAMLIGLGRRCLDLSVAYARDRHQFGRPIGSYQALRHRMADDWTALEFARPLVWRAAWSVAHGHRDASLHVSMAKAAAGDAATSAGRTAVQVHGAMGYTFECDVHLFLKRILALASSHGDSHQHRRRIAAELRGRDIERVPR